MYEHVLPVPVKAPRLVLFNVDLSHELRIDAVEAQTKAGVAVFSGNAVHSSWTPYAQAYSGHQFRHLSPLLGDGRAVVLGAVQGLDASVGLQEIQLKGSGRTPFSRGSSDGRATLSSVVREYILSEAVHALNVPTTRSLACVATGESVKRPAETGGEKERGNREVHMNERVQEIAGGVLTRVSQMFVRIGTFERFAIADPSSIRALADLVLSVQVANWPLQWQAHWTAWQQEQAQKQTQEQQEQQEQQQYKCLSPCPCAESCYCCDYGKYGLFCLRVATEYAQLVAKWMCVGFVHGVMNTDNALLTPVATLDYGPCAFLDEYDPDKVFSSIDGTGLYAYGKQAEAAAWNVERLRLALAVRGSTIDLGKLDEKTLRNHFDEAYRVALNTGMAAKIGLAYTHQCRNEDIEPRDVEGDVEGKSQAHDPQTLYHRPCRGTCNNACQGQGQSQCHCQGQEPDNTHAAYQVQVAQLVQDLLDTMAREQSDFTLTFRELADTGSIRGAAFAPWLDRWRAQVNVSAKAKVKAKNLTANLQANWAANRRPTNRPDWKNNVCENTWSSNGKIGLPYSDKANYDDYDDYDDDEYDADNHDDIQYVDKEYVDKTYVDKDQRASDPALALALALATQPHIVLMRAHNPVYVPRNHRVNAALVALEKQKDCTLVRELLDCLRTPFKRQGRFADLEISPSQAERVARTYCGT